MRKLRLVSLLLALMLLFGILAGCGDATGDPSSSSSESSSSSSESSLTETPETREIVDMANRTVTVPYEVNTGFSTGAVGTILLYTLDPAVLTGVNYKFNDAEAAFILEEYRDLPEYGQGGGLNLEAVVAAAPDVLIILGVIDDAAIAAADEMQEQTGIPCVMMKDSMADIPASYRLAGEVFGREERGEELAKYAEETLAFADTIDIPEAERVRVYYGNGLENLETAPAGSSHAELFELVQAVNVAVVEGEDITARIDISAEQVIGWNPDVVLLNGEPTENFSPADAVDDFLNNPNYSNVAAVEQEQVYAIPKYPFSWFDRPPGPNRLLGIHWLTGLLYGDTYEVDIKAKAAEFYQLFYHMELTDAEMTELLGF